MILLKDKVDLHTHSTASDGSYTPCGLVRHAAAEGLAAIALTDHDTVDGIEQAWVEGKKAGIEVIPGVEISTGQEPEIHILGYFSYEKYRNMDSTLKFIREKRKERNPQIISKLQDMDIDIDYEDVARETGGEVMGRLHIARALCRKGYARDIQNAFECYLSEGKPAFAQRIKLTTKEGIWAISQAGGLPVLAHPIYLNRPAQQVEEFIHGLVPYGLKGIEVYYCENSVKETKFFERLAANLDMIPTGGSDFHGDNRPGVFIGRGRGNLEINYCILERIKSSLSV